MQATLISVATVIVLVMLGLAVCIGSDTVERRWRLKRLRRSMLAQADVPDDQFAAALGEMAGSHALEMRRMLAELLGVNAAKIRPDWRFREDPNLKNMDYGIFCAFAERYAPERLRDHQSFVFPDRAVITVRDLFLAVARQKSEDWHSRP